MNCTQMLVDTTNTCICKGCEKPYFNEFIILINRSEIFLKPQSDIQIIHIKINQQNLITLKHIINTIIQI